MVTVKNLSSVDHKRIRLTPVDGAVANISQSQGAIAKDGDNVLICLAPMVDEIPSNEMHFTTLAGSADYVGQQGDQILLSDGTILDVTVTDETFTFDVPAGKHKVVLVESVDRSNFVSVGGGALTELINFPALSTVTKFNFSTYEYTDAPNLTKVPEHFPSNITDIEDLFNTTVNFNQDISMWDVSNVKIFDYVFSMTDMAFNQPLNTWNVSNATSMRALFVGAPTFNHPLDSWDVSNVTNMWRMFEGATSFNQDLSSWNVSNVTNMFGMFDGATSFNQDISEWDVSKVIEMPAMFRGANAFNQDISKWDVSNVTDMRAMFNNATSFNQDLSQWCVPLIAYIPSSFDENAPLFTTDKHPVWGTCPRGENLIKTGFMNLKIDTTNATLTTEDLNQYLGFDVKPNESVTIDWGDGTIVRVDDTNGTWVELNHTYQVGNIYTLSIETINIDFIEARGKLITEIVDFGLGDTLRDLNAVNLIKVPNILPSHITELASLFYDATSFNQDISGWDTSNVTGMNGMFKGAASFNQDISAWDVSKVTDMFSMFEGATSFNADIGGWDVSNVTKMTAMFRDATAFNQNLSQWCVGLIPALPTAFDTGATLFTTDKHPVWGTCPVV